MTAKQAGLEQAVLENGSVAPVGRASSPPAWIKPAENIPLGILYMIVATVAFAVMHALSKWLIAAYPIGQVMFARSFVGLIICSAFVLPQREFSVFAAQKAGAPVMRGLSTSI